MDTRLTPPVDPFTLDWGSITPDTISNDGVAIHVVAHDLATASGLGRTIRFINARVAIFARQLPAAMKQGVTIDDRGQDLPGPARDHLRASLAPGLAFVKFFSEGL